MKTIKFFQFTDSHLFGESDSTLCGLDTTASLKKVLTEAKRFRWKPDFILTTGDVSQDWTPRSYRKFKNLVGSFGVPVHACPGNHDDPSQLEKILGGNRWENRNHLIVENWSVILLDSTIPWKTKGRLRSSELRRLQKILYRYPHHPTLICFHHPPVPMASRWLDTMMIENASQFYQVIKRAPQVKGVLFGHVHQSFKKKINGVLHLGTPSTCIQFRPRNPKMGLDKKNPGFRWLELFPDGSIKTGVKRVKNYSLRPDYSAKGY